MTPAFFVSSAIAPALSLLPAQMDSAEARAMVLAIALQESGLAKRRQMGNGPARSYLQFERLGIKGVLKHRRASIYAKALSRALDVVPNVPAVYRAIEFQDVLAVVFARLRLWTLPKPLPPAHDPIEGWYQYLEAWRPGKPHEATWASNYQQAWAVIRGETT